MTFFSVRISTFHVLSSSLHIEFSFSNDHPHQVPLSKLGRVKNIARSSLVTLPRFVRDQAKYKAILRQVGRLNGILPEDVHPEAGLKQTTRRRTKSLSPEKRRSKTKLAPADKRAGGRPAQNQDPMGSSTRKQLRQKPAAMAPHKPNHPTPPAPPLHSPPEKNRLGFLTSPEGLYASNHRQVRDVSSKEGSTRSTERISGPLQDSKGARRFFSTHGAHFDQRSSKSGPMRPHTRPGSSHGERERWGGKPGRSLFVLPSL